ncbi:type I secretion membrane fusion protein, HlyD family [Pseudomonas fluorescens Q2-87]|uniref:Membrane fusion protein (MFP) family protein n=1 Tax=Pseudomonas fluorescens (strain Q2-87) TaxID=1038922 RepID=J2EMN1_PSEFQ|nr:HlyD family type I secretion periplasmic adaptor subunit [Pseudomonas fluorescens]EJL04875.1 type I secretion membrane fusion protein, HlyD family [Pseudomonas fluorescens Q2-87]
MHTDQEVTLTASLSRHLRWGAISLVVLLGGGLTWAVCTNLSGAVIATGVVAVEGSVKTIQHPTGGVVAELLVKEGQAVAAGDVLLRLDATLPAASQAIVSKSLNQAWARLARLEAERDNASEVAIPQELLTRMSVDEAKAVMAIEQQLFLDRRASREGQKKQLRERVQQLNETIAGHDIQQKTKQEEIELIDSEYQAVKKLFDKGMMTLDRVNALARGIARLRGERGQLMASIAEARGKIAETELQRLQVDQTFRSEVSQELRDLLARQGELIEREITASDQLKRVDIISPIAGRVQQLAVHTIGGVISPAEGLMQIVPADDELLVEAKISAQDIDQLTVGQSAILRLSAFNRSTTPELTGTVVRLSADLIQDERTGIGFYRAGIKIPKSELAKLQGLALVPGMPVESMIQTGSRNVMSYLLKPISDHAQRAFREG